MRGTRGQNGATAALMAKVLGMELSAVLFPKSEGTTCGVRREANLGANGRENVIRKEVERRGDKREARGEDGAGTGTW